ncbi:MAG: orotidine-5'-phosphate decarboxylase [Patescibacteria group bacterium]
MKAKTKPQLIVALDVGSHDEALTLMTDLRGTVEWLKVGMELFVAEGHEVIKSAKALGFKVFLDLKFKDIPNTVSRAIKAAGKLGVDMVNIHLDGGSEMIAAAAKAASEFPGMTLLGVTVLTSSTPKTLIEVNVRKVAGHPMVPIEQVMDLVRLGCSNGIRGMVCSPQEVNSLRNFGDYADTLILVTPAIRPPWAATPDDQKRATTVQEAVEAGSNFLVVGRPVYAPPTNIKTPFNAACRILAEIDEAWSQN